MSSVFPQPPVEKVQAESEDNRIKMKDGHEYEVTDRRPRTTFRWLWLRLVQGMK